MEKYILLGVVHPERALIESHQINITFSHPATKKSGKLEVKILMNDIFSQVETNNLWDIYDLKNVVVWAIQSELSKIGFITGNDYRPEINRIINHKEQIDFVYGVNISCISQRSQQINFDDKLHELRAISIGENGIYIQSCLNDLMYAIRYPENTAFFCYRAIELLRNHYKKSIKEEMNDSELWTKFREFCGLSSRDEIDFIKKDADPIRHGSELVFQHKKRDEILLKTWNLVDTYFSKLKEECSNH
ncbi:hypothetical protein [Legionella pneumophila]